MHAELQALVAADQADREGAVPSDLADRNRQRVGRVRQILAETPPGSLDGADLFAAALICQHGPTLTDLERARQLAMRAADLGHPNARYLAAAATDRLLMRRGEPQRFGTQRLQVGDEPAALWPIESATTDDDRRAWDVPPLAELLARVDGRVIERDRYTF